MKKAKERGKERSHERNDKKKKREMRKLIMGWQKEARKK